jgi:DNA-binding NarL/FixJ family response regulator
MTETIRVLVVDDQPLVRAGFSMILQSEDDLELVGEASTGLEAITAVQELSPDVVLMDIRMPELDGVEATRQIREVPDSPAVLMLTTFDLDEYVYASLRAGASGFMLKDSPADDLIEAIRVVARGDALIAPSVTKRLISEFAAQGPRPDRAAFDELTERENEVLLLMAKGLSNAEIASELILGETTIKTHVGRILMKLNARDRVQAVIAAYESGAVTPRQS